MDKKAQRKIKDIRINVYRPTYTDMFIKFLLNNGLRQCQGEGMYSLNSFDVVMNGKNAETARKNWKLYSVVASNFTFDYEREWSWVMDDRDMPIDIRCSANVLMCIAGNDLILKFKNRDLYNDRIKPLLVADVIGVDLSVLDDDDELRMKVYKCYCIGKCIRDISNLAVSGVTAQFSDSMDEDMFNARSRCLILSLDNSYE